MAAGGPIVHPSIPCLLITPLCSMTLSSRPLVLPGSSVIKFQILHDACSLEVSGNYSRILLPGDTVAISTSSFPVTTFARNDATKDFVKDLGDRLWYERQVRKRRLGG
jgi:NAD kinase